MKKIDIDVILENKDYITVDIVGDSITNGTNYCGLDDTYVAQFAKMLAGKYPEATVCRYDGKVVGELLPIEKFEGPVKISEGSGKKRIDVIKNGVGGNTVRRAINRIENFTGTLANGKSADITVFMFGINDALNDPAKYVTPEKFREDYVELLQKFRKTEKSAIVIMSATTSQDPIAEYVETAKQIAEENGFVYVDQNAKWNGHYDPSAPNFGHGGWLSDNTGDPWHPTPEGARAIAEKLFEFVN